MGFTFFAFVVTTAVVLLIPNRYKSVASIMPAEGSDLVESLGSVSSPVKSFSSKKILTKIYRSAENNRCLAILKSDTVLHAVIRKFDLVHVYGITSYPLENSKKELLDNIEFIEEPEGNILITVLDTDPQRAAQIANYFIEMLNKVNTELMAYDSNGNRRFIEEYYKSVHFNLIAAEDSLKRFTEKYNIIQYQKQVAASIDLAVEFTGQLAMKEIEVNVMRKTLQVDHPAVITLEKEIDGLRAKLLELYRGKNIPTNGVTGFVPFSEITNHEIEYLRKYYNVAIQNSIMEIITPLYQQAQAEQHRNTPIVDVLDRATPAERKSRPRRLLSILGGMIIGGLSTFSFSMIYDNWIRLKEQKAV
jgi:tyrosine-protein kinase Etk/Wzc